jgi:hypothetical protein
MVSLCESCHGINHDDVNALWEEMDYRTDPAKQSAVAILDRCANECLLEARFTAPQCNNTDAADMLMSACQYLIHSSYHRSAGGVATNRVYHIIANQPNMSYCDMLANESK